MLDISDQHPFEACTAFALNWLKLLAERDYDGATSVVDDYRSSVPLHKCFRKEHPALLHPDKFFDWSVRFIGNDKTGLSMDLEVPFTDEEYRPLEARFDFA